MRSVRQLDLLDARPELLGQRQRPLERLAHARFQLPAGSLGSRPAAPTARPGARRRGAPRAGRDRLGELQRGRIAGVLPDHLPEQQRRVADVARQRPSLVQRGGERDHPVARDRAVGRLQPDDPAQRRRLADRAAGVRAQRPRREAGRDRRGAAAGGAARARARDPTGCSAGPNAEFSFEEPIANSSWLVFASSVAPASGSRCTDVAVYGGR